LTQENSDRGAHTLGFFIADPTTVIELASSTLPITVS